jgi:exonuclease III
MSTVKIIAWNINGVQGSDITILPHQNAFIENYSLIARWTSILNNVVSQNPDIACLFEISVPF